MKRTLSFFGFLFGFIGMCVALAGLSQNAVSGEDKTAGCAYVSQIDDGYGVGPSQAACR